MSLGTNILSILKALQNVTGASQRIEGLINDGFAAINKRLDDLDLSLDNIEIQIGQPETGNFNSNPEDPSMSVLQMTVGDQPHGPKILTFSEPGAPADGAVASSDPTIATMSLDPTDHATWSITLATPSIPGVTTFSYSGTSDPPDAGPVVVEPLVLTVVAVPSAETGQFNP